VGRIVARAARRGSDVHRAISDPTRRRILDLLSEGERSVQQLVSGFRISQPAISQHLRVLREAGLVRVRRQGRLRVYSLRTERLREVRDWLAALDSQMLYGPVGRG
jgi:DNA-binding transcriptional ArsR family regulator